MSPIAVIFTVVAYIVVLFAVAYLSGRKADNAGFFTGNRQTPWYMAAIAMIGAAMSGVTFISVPGSVRVDAFSYMQMVLGFTVGQLVVAFVLIPLFYRMKVVSLYEYLNGRFGVRSHKTGAWFFFISKSLGAALRVYVVCAVMQLLVFDHYGLPFWLNMLLTMGLVWLYTQQGGVKSLIWTDSLKTICLVASVVLCTLFITRELGLSFRGAVTAVQQSDYSQMFFLQDSSSAHYFWKMFFAGVFTLIATTGLDQDMMQRNLSCASPRDSQKNIIISALSQMVVIYLFLCLGVLLYIYADRNGIQLPTKSDQVFPLIAVHGGLPTVVGVLFVLGLIASTYSAAGSALTALTTSFTVDILDGTHRYTDERLTRVRRSVHIAMAVLMGLFILCFEAFGNDSVINLVYKVASYTYGPILGMFVFGMFTHRALRDRWIPLVAVSAPLLSALLQYVANSYLNYHIGFELLIYNALFTMGGMFILSIGYNEQKE